MKWNKNCFELPWNVCCAWLCYLESALFSCFLSKTSWIPSTLLIQTGRNATRIFSVNIKLFSSSWRPLKIPGKQLSMLTLSETNQLQVLSKWPWHYMRKSWWFRVCVIFSKLFHSFKVITKQEIMWRMCRFLEHRLVLCKTKTAIPFGMNCSILRQNTRLFVMNG